MSELPLEPRYVCAMHERLVHAVLDTGHGSMNELMARLDAKARDIKPPCDACCSIVCSSHSLERLAAWPNHFIREF